MRTRIGAGDVTDDTWCVRTRVGGCLQRMKLPESRIRRVPNLPGSNTANPLFKSQRARGGGDRGASLPATSSPTPSTNGKSSVSHNPAGPAPAHTPASTAVPAPSVTSSLQAASDVFASSRPHRRTTFAPKSSSSATRRAAVLSQPFPDSGARGNPTGATPRAASAASPPAATSTRNPMRDAAALRAALHARRPAASAAGASGSGSNNIDPRPARRDASSGSSSSSSSSSSSASHRLPLQRVSSWRAGNAVIGAQAATSGGSRGDGASGRGGSSGGGRKGSGGGRGRGGGRRRGRRAKRGGGRGLLWR